MPRIILRAPMRIFDKMLKEIDLTEHKLRHRVDSGAVMHVIDEQANDVVTLSPGMWDSILHDTPPHPEQ